MQKSLPWPSADKRGKSPKMHQKLHFRRIWRFFCNQHRIWPGEGSTVQWKWSPAAPSSLKALLFPPPIKECTKQGNARGTNEVWHGTSSIHFHCPVPRSSGLGIPVSPYRIQNPHRPEDPRKLLKNYNLAHPGPVPKITEKLLRSVIL